MLKLMSACVKVCKRERERERHLNGLDRGHQAKVGEHHHHPDDWRCRHSTHLGTKKENKIGVITKGVFSLEESLESLHSLHSLKSLEEGGLSFVFHTLWDL